MNGQDLALRLRRSVLFVPASNARAIEKARGLDCDAIVLDLEDSVAPEADFPGLKPGDRWCVCAPRWKEALDAGMAPPVVLEATHEETLAIVPLGVLKDHAVSA